MIEITPGLLRVPVKYSKKFTRLHQVYIMLKIRVVFVFIRSVHAANIGQIIEKMFLYDFIYYLK